MRLLQLCMVFLISMVLGLGAAPVDAFAKDAAKDTATKSMKSDTSSKKKAAEKPVNINTASKEELQMLPGVGPVMADAILKYKKANGKFKSADDLLNVKGIGEKTLKKMKPLLKF